MAEMCIPSGSYCKAIDLEGRTVTCIVRGQARQAAWTANATEVCTLMSAMAATHNVHRCRNGLLPCIVYLLASCLVVACYASIQKSDHGFDIGSLEAALGKVAMRHGRRRLHATVAPACLLKAEVGLCRASLTRYHYDATTGTCKEFVYGGCGGNDNNFGTQEQCMETCAPGPQHDGSSTPNTSSGQQGGTPPAAVIDPSQPTQGFNPSKPDHTEKPSEPAVPAPAPASSHGQQTQPGMFAHTALFACMAMLLWLL